MALLPARLSLTVHMSTSWEHMAQPMVCVWVCDDRSQGRDYRCIGLLSADSVIATIALPLNHVLFSDLTAVFEERLIFFYVTCGPSKNNQMFLWQFSIFQYVHWPRRHKQMEFSSFRTQTWRNAGGVWVTPSLLFVSVCSGEEWARGSELRHRAEQQFPLKLSLVFSKQESTKVPRPTLPAGPARSHRFFAFFIFAFFSNFVAAFSVWAPKCCQTRHVNIYSGHFSKARLTEDSKGEGRSRCASLRRSSRPDDGADWCSPAAVHHGLRRPERPFAACVTSSFLSWLWWGPVVCQKEQKTKKSSCGKK